MWIEANVQYGPGPLVGQPYRLAPFLKTFLYRFYEYNPKTGRFFYDDALFGMAKGNSKSEFAGALGLFEFAGPCVLTKGPDGFVPAMQTSPEVTVLASNYDQTDLVFGSAQEMGGLLAADGYIEIFEKQMLLKDGLSGKFDRVAAVRGANDGRRPTCLLIDEHHEIVDQKEGAILVLENGLTKRQGRVVKVTTAGSRLETRCGQDYERGMKIVSGEKKDNSFLFMWYQADQKWDLTKHADLRDAIRQANPAPWTDINRIAKRLLVDGMPEYEFRRYYLNQWTATAVQWLPTGVWDKLAHTRKIPDKSKTVLAFDGSYNRDSTALYAWLLDDKLHGFTVGVWERPQDADDTWVIPRHEIDVAVDDMFERFEVVEFVCDRAMWYDEFDRWWERYGDVVTEYSSPAGHYRRRAFIDGCTLFYAAAVNGDFTHDGDPTIARHLSNAVVKETVDGAYIVKEGRRSPRKIDGAVAAVQGYSRAVWFTEQPDQGIQVAWA